MSMGEPTKGFSLAVLRESLFKCRGDSTATKNRIKRLKAELVEVNDRVSEQQRQNDAVQAEVTKMKVSKATLLTQIEERTAKLDKLTSQNTNFVKDKVLQPADDGISAAKDAIQAFEEIKTAGFKLQVLLQRENPEKESKETYIDLPYEKPTDSEAELLFSKVLEREEKLFTLQKELREAQDISRGGRPKSSAFASITRTEWEKRVSEIDKIRQETAEAQAELDRIEAEEAQKAAQTEGGAGDNGHVEAMETEAAANDVDELLPESGRPSVEPVAIPESFSGNEGDEVPYQGYYASQQNSLDNEDDESLN